MKKSNFSKFIQSMDQDELRNEIDTLYSKIKEVKEYYAMELGSETDRKKVFENAKKNITRYYRTKSYRKPKPPRIRYIQNLLKEIHQLSIFDHEMVDLYLFNVETALTFMREYYFSSISLNNNIVKSFQKACDMISAGKLQDMFVYRVQNIMAQSGYFKDFYLEMNNSFIETFK